MVRSLASFVAILLVVACSKEKASSSTASSASPGSSAAVPASAAAVVGVPSGSPPPDGKYERVVVDGVTVPMVQVMDTGATVLVDTDGKKPRDWEEQYKRKRASLVTGQYDLHKSNANNNSTFEDDPIDKEGLWIIDAKGNIARH